MWLIENMNQIRDSHKIMILTNNYYTHDRTLLP